MGRKRTYGRAGRTSDREAEPYLREYGALQLSRRLVYLSLIFAWPGVATKAAESAGWAAGPHAVEPLTVAEEHDPAAAEIARRFNPAMALPDRDGPWPVSVGYPGAAAPICSRARSPATTLSFAPTRRSRTPTSTASPWGDLPDHDARGNRIEYWIDGPGDDRRARRSDRLAPALARDRREDAHPVRARVLAGPRARPAGRSSTGSSIHSTSGSTTTRATGSTSTSCSRDRRASGRRPTYRAVGYEYYFHGYRLETDRPVRVEDRGRPGDARQDHPMVFVGGHGQRALVVRNAERRQLSLARGVPGAGGGVGPFAVADDTRVPARILEPERFHIVMLPEPARLDATRPPRAVVAEAAVLRRTAARVREPAARGSVRRREAAAAAGAPPRMELDSDCARSGPARRSRRRTARLRPSWGLIPMAFLRSTPSFGLAGRTTGARTGPAQSRVRPRGRRPIVSTAAERQAQCRWPARCPAPLRPARTLLPAGRAGREQRFRSRTARRGSR